MRSSPFLCPDRPSWLYRAIAVFLAAQMVCPPQGLAAGPVSTPVSVQSGYDGNGNVITRIDGNGAVTAFTYDKMNRLTDIDYPGGASPDVSFIYDVNGNRTSMTDATGTTEYDYDQFDRLTDVFYPDGGFVNYGYDFVGNVTGLRYGNTKTATANSGYTELAYTFDEDNRMKTVQDVLANTTTSYTYDDAGHPQRRTLPNGVTTDYGYDGDGRLTSVDHKKADATRICKYTYTLNAIGNRTKVIETLPDGSTRTTSYGYDPLDRLSTAAYPDGRSVAYLYDSFGNRTKMTEVTGATTKVTDYTCDNDSRLLSTKVNGVADETFTYDATGNLLQRVRASDNRQIDYAYDFENRLVRFFDGTNNVQYVYNGSGSRVAKIVNGARTNFVNDGNRKYVQVLSETDAGGNTQRIYEWGNELIEQQSGALLGYNLADSFNGSVRRVLDAASGTLNTYDYDAFGKLTAKNEKLANSYQFDSESQDETGLLFLRSRYVDEGIGRFITRDTLGHRVNDPRTLNPYSFVRSDPVNLRDPSGQCPVCGVAYLVEEGGVLVVEEVGGPALVQRLGFAAAGVGLTPTTAFVEGAVVNISARAAGYAAAGSIAAATVASNPGAQFYGGLILGATLPDDVSKAVDQSLHSNVPEEFDAGFKFGSAGKDMFDLGEKSGLFDDVIDSIESRFSSSPKVPQTGSYWEGGFDFDMPGGVALDKSASVLLDINNITGGTYDAATGQIILFGTKDTSATALPKISLDDLAVAVRAKQLGSFPVVSIDPPTISSPPEWPGRNCFTVRYGDYYTDPMDGQTKVLDVSSNTRFGWVMFEADRLMKSLALGKDSITQQAIGSGVPGYANLPARIKSNRSPYQGNLDQRFWFEPSEIVLQPSNDGKSMQIAKAAMQLSTEAMYASQGQVEGIREAEDFATWFTTNYDAIAEEQVSIDPSGQPRKIYKELKQLAYVAGVVKWIDDYKVPVDLSFLQSYKPTPYATPTVTPETSVFTAYTDRNGKIETITLSGGVTFCNDLAIGTGGNPSGLGAAAVAARPAETSLGWTFSSGGNTYNATAFSVDRTQKDGGMSPAAVDAQFQVNGKMPLTLARYFNSSNVTQTLFGWGWQAQPYALEFKENREVFSICHQTYSGYGEVWFVDRASKGAYKFIPAGVYDNTGDPRHIASRFDPTKDILVYRYEGKTTPGLLFSDNATRMTMQLDSGVLLDFNFDGLLTQVEDPNGNKIVYLYDSAKRLISIAQPSVKGITLSYDAQNRVASATRPDGRIVTYSYDTSGNLASAQVSAPNGRFFRYAYDSSHNLTQLQDENGNAAATQTLDVYGRVTGITQPGVTTPFVETYNLATRTSHATGPENVSRTTVFNTNNDPVSFTDARSNTTTMTFNSYRDMTSLSTPDSQTRQFYVDAAGHRVTTVVPSGRADWTFFDDQGNVTDTFHGPTDGAFAGLFDSEHILTSGDPVAGYATGSMQFGYDTKRNRTSITDANSHTRAFGYDPRGNMFSSKDARGKETILTYDATSRLTASRNALGHQVNSLYDTHDNLKQLSTLAGTVDYGYNTKDQVTSMTTGNSGARHTYSYTYDARGHISTVTDPSGYVTQYSYDLRGNLVEVKHGGIVRFAYDYDGLNRLKATRYTGTAGGARSSGAPVIMSGTSATAVKGQSFNYQIVASNNPTSFAAGALPAGLTVNTSTGLISGTPAATGTFNVTLRATNGSGTGGATLTLTIKPAVPSVTVTAATPITSAGATLRGMVNPNGLAATSRFDYGLTTAYSASTPVVAIGAGTSSVPVTAILTGLQPNTTYHYRLVASNGAGATVSADQSFKTLDHVEVGSWVVQQTSRTLPLSVNNTVNIGTFNFASAGAGILEITADVSGTAYSVSKQFVIPMRWNEPPANVWVNVLPNVDTGASSNNNFAMDANIAGSMVTLRLRTIASDGAHVGTATLTIKSTGLSSFVNSTTTGNVTPPPLTFIGNSMDQLAGQVGIATPPSLDGLLDISGGSNKGFRLRARSVTGAPTDGTWSRGTIIVDSAGTLYVCTSAGTPGTWKKVGN